MGILDPYVKCVFEHILNVTFEPDHTYDILPIATPLCLHNAPNIVKWITPNT